MELATGSALAQGADLPTPIPGAIGTAHPATLPSLYDLPSEDREEPGLPDEFYDLQLHLLSATLRLTGYTKGEIFTGYDADGQWIPTSEEAAQQEADQRWANQAIAVLERLRQQLRDRGIDLDGVVL